MDMISKVFSTVLKKANIDREIEEFLISLIDIFMKMLKIAVWRFDKSKRVSFMRE